MEEDEMEEHSPGLEKAALVTKEESLTDTEMYSSKKCFQARSCKLAIVVSIVVAVVLVIIAASIAIVLAVTTSREHSDLNVLTLEDVFKAEFQSKIFRGQWIESHIVYMSADEGVVLYDPDSDEEETIITAEDLVFLNGNLSNVAAIFPSPTYLSGDNKVILLAANRHSVYRHSGLFDYYLYNISTMDIINLTKPEGLDHVQFQYATWSPNGEWIAYVIDYNIYILNVLQVDSSPIPITTGGSKYGFVYGIPDWVYEEEVLSSDHAMWWSPDSQRLLYIAFDDRNVQPYSFPIYGDTEEQYDTVTTIPYPKPGTSNPLVSIHVTDISTPTTNTSLLPASLFDFEHYIAYAGWVDEDRVYVGWLNRTQTFIEFCTYEEDSDQCDLLYSYEVPGSWVEQYGSDSNNVLVFSEANSSPTLLTLLSQEEGSGEDSSTHMAMVHAGEDPIFLTGPGLWTVTNIVGHHNQDILYISTENSPLQRHLYSYNTATQENDCLTCDQEDWSIPTSPNPAIPSQCSYFDASCDERLEYCVVNCRGPSIPYSLIARFDKDNRELTIVRNKEVNEELRHAVMSLDLPSTHFFTVPSDQDGPELHGKMTYPPRFDSDKDYPVLVYVYGGPGSQVVDEQCILNSLSLVFYVSNLNIILVSVDGRGTGFRSNGFKYVVYKNLGLLDTMDQIRTGRYLQSLSFVDERKLAIYGASYGGYMAGMVGSSNSGVYRAAISQSPVSDWLYYDSAYTERYMLKPNDNLQSYEDSSLVLRAGSLSKVDYLLIHGTSDDNVHYQHTAHLAEALTQADVQFRMQVYTDKTHSLTGGNTRRHLYQLIADFLRESFEL